MKKILLFSVLVAMVAASCKKNPGNPSIIVTASFPTITQTNAYFSTPVGGSLPAGSSIGTAYDSVYKTNISLVVIDTNVHTSVPGLYQCTATATNKYGYVSSVTYFVAVTNLSFTPNLPGAYQMGGNDSAQNNVALFETGYYSMDNYGGVNILANPGTGTQALFAIITDSTIAFTDANFGTVGSITYATGDTSLIYNGMTYSKP